MPRGSFALRINRSTFGSTCLQFRFFKNCATFLTVQDVGFLEGLDHATKVGCEVGIRVFPQQRGPFSVKHDGEAIDDRDCVRHTRLVVVETIVVTRWTQIGDDGSGLAGLDLRTCGRT